MGNASSDQDKKVGLVIASSLVSLPCIIANRIESFHFLLAAIIALLAVFLTYSILSSAELSFSMTFGS